MLQQPPHHSIPTWLPSLELILSFLSSRPMIQSNADVILLVIQCRHVPHIYCGKYHFILRRHNKSRRRRKLVVFGLFVPFGLLNFRIKALFPTAGSNPFCCFVLFCVLVELDQDNGAIFIVFPCVVTNI